MLENSQKAFFKEKNQGKNPHCLHMEQHRTKTGGIKKNTICVRSKADHSQVKEIDPDENQKQLGEQSTP